MRNIVGRKIEIERLRFKEIFEIENVSEIVPGIYSITGKNDKRKMTVTVTLNEIENKLI